MTLSIEPRLGQPGDLDRASDSAAAPAGRQKTDVELPILRAERPVPDARRRRRRRASRLRRRILTLNVLALVIPVAGLLYLDQYRDNLVESELEALRTEGQLFAAALGEAGVTAGEEGDERLMPELARLTLRRMVEISKHRARLFGQDGALVADSLRLYTPGGQVEIEPLLPPAPESLFEKLMTSIYTGVLSLLPSGHRWPLYPGESVDQRADNFPEVQRALGGEVGRAVYERRKGGLILDVAVPVQRYRQVLGALVLSSDGADIDDAVRSVRFDILKVFGVALAITVLISSYLARTIARPISRLADAADRVRRGHGRQIDIPDFSRRRDEIGDLSGALRDMTRALWQRMDAIEHFAADVAHEIKNPLTSLRSAVETVARLEDPAQQKRLMTIILDDVERLNRLITDISDASRLDAELSRAEMAPVDIASMLQALAELHEATMGPDDPPLRLEIASYQHLVVTGIEGRLVQVWRNLISNAISFSPAGGSIRIAAARAGDKVRIAVSDDGPGIPPEKLTDIFDRFYSERPAGEKFGTHSGLGLSISKQIVEAHGGSIVAANRTAPDGRVLGAVFTVTLPAA
ncbi:MAG TPA: stimulus-sensing domain-containing protein [Methylomirabilota bacterium]|nr:stimulus-sensing domain-containing protein [Methylomirabilota bacterium]